MGIIRCEWVKIERTLGEVNAHELVCDLSSFVAVEVCDCNLGHDVHGVIQESEPRHACFRYFVGQYALGYEHENIGAVNYMQD